jgi:hypothetical protein
MVDHNAPRTELHHGRYWVTLQGSEAEIWLTSDEATPSFDGPAYLIQTMYPDLWTWLLDEGYVKPA